MFGWLEALIVSLLAGITIIIILILLIRRRFTSDHTATAAEHHRQTAGEPKTTPSQTELPTKRRPSYHLFRRESSTKTGFNWADHPTLITDAVENGWSRFAFTTYAAFPAVRSSSRFGSLRVSGESEFVEESWEIGPGSVDFMQKLKFKKGWNNNNNSTTVIRMRLPLPGPPAAESFPQEAYFEITVVDLKEDGGRLLSGEGEKMKLLFQQSNSTGQLGLFHVSSRNGSHLLEELKYGGRGGGGGGGGVVKMTIGLSGGGSVTSRIPGSYPGSIGFNSDGSVFLAGMKLVFESEKEDWAKCGKVIGCGFDPKKKKVYFTVDSELVHVIHCKSEDFGMPLYPVLATTLDITVIVNLGQSNFCYSPSNAHRTPNPCFIRPVANSSAAAVGYEDSRELFSMGRIDAEWRSRNTAIKGTISNNDDGNKYPENEDGEAEFIEIVLDSKGR